MSTISLNINGKDYQVEAESDTPLLWVLRDTLGMTGTKYGCGKSLCGACTVQLNGAAIRSCSIPVVALSGSKIKTIEGLAPSEDSLHPVQEAWMEENVPQCGYCQAGQIMSAVALLEQNPNPNDEDIEGFMSGNICRCGTYPRIKKAIKKAAEKMR